ncbi:MAG: ankyrin repeat domain-containing protein [Gammaproteobacteria bacterium]|nr:ankyrin repeat domain-containing protein [Gammaproteobacteria bacterium]MCH9744631.1 ankyrin repeat domain-containing protein [Gammaproteobacteria bacterium]
MIEQAIRSGDMATLVANQAAIQATIKDNPEWLVIASEDPSTSEIITYLIEKCGANPNAYDASRNLPLTVAASSGNETAVALLTSQYNADINGTLIDGGDYDDQPTEVNSPFTAAMSKGHWDTAIYLAQNGADIHRQSVDGYTAFDYLKHDDHAVEILKLLIGNGFNPATFVGIDSPIYSILYGYQQIKNPGSVPETVINLIKILIAQGNVDIQLKQMLEGCKDGGYCAEQMTSLLKEICPEIFPQESVKHYGASLFGMVPTTPELSTCSDSPPTLSSLDGAEDKVPKILQTLKPPTFG